MLIKRVHSRFQCSRERKNSQRIPYKSMQPPTFHGNVSSQFSKRSLKNSILDIPMSMQVSAQALWTTILQFVDDMGEVKYENEDEKASAQQHHEEVSLNTRQEFDGDEGIPGYSHHFLTL
jgi:hypothetical protein